MVSTGIPTPQGGELDVGAAMAAVEEPATTIALSDAALWCDRIYTETDLVAICVHPVDEDVEYDVYGNEYRTVTFRVRRKATWISVTTGARTTPLRMDM
jgi:hypothetical protein